MPASPHTTQEVDPRRPVAAFLERERNERGTLDSVLTVLLRNRECPWHCVFCDLAQHALKHSVSPGDIPAQIEWALAETRVNRGESLPRQARSTTARDPSTGARPSGRFGETAPGPEDSSAASSRPSTEGGSESALPRSTADAGEPTALADSAARPVQVKLYNAGSFFDARAIPPADDPVVARQVAEAGFERVIVESHPALIGDRCWRFRDHLQREATRRGFASRLEVAMGLETANSEVFARLEKGITLEDFSAAAAALRREGVAMRAFVLVQPPFQEPAQAVAWAVRSVAFAFDQGATAVSLIPVRGGAGTMVDLEARGFFLRPTLATLEHAMEGALAQAAGRGRVFADLWDLERFSACAACFGRRVERLRRLNCTQRDEPAVACGECSAGIAGSR